jgi:fatty-acyl-CoA synthase
MTEITDASYVRRAHRNELSPLSFLDRSEFVYPHKVAVVHEDRRYTYREMGERVRRLASALRGAGLKKGDRVAFIAPNIPALLEAHYGVPAAGGVLVAINYRLNREEVQFMAKGRRDLRHSRDDSTLSGQKRTRFDQYE